MEGLWKGRGKLIKHDILVNSKTIDNIDMSRERNKKTSGDPMHQEAHITTKNTSDQVDYRHNIINNTDSTIDMNNNWFRSLDKDYFKKYLREPEYIKAFNKNKGIKQFRRFFLAQELQLSENDSVKNTSTTSINESSIWSIKFSKDGKYMAIGGKNKSLYIWKVISSPLERLELNHIHNQSKPKRQTFSGPNQYSVDNTQLLGENLSSNGNILGSTKISNSISSYAPVFHPYIYRQYSEHEQDILDIDWSKNNFIITSSMDKTVKLWHCNRRTSLKTFKHSDFVTCTRFFPQDDRFFVSGCLDHKLRLWSILDEKVLLEFDCDNLITSMDISADGKITVIGTFNGYIYVLTTNNLQLLYSFHLCEDGNSHNKNWSGPKVTGIECFYSRNEPDVMKFLITSNDSKIRIYDSRDHRLLEVLRGLENEHSQIAAHHAYTQRGVSCVISGSENHWIYCWKIADEENNNTSDNNKSDFKTSNKRLSLTRSSSLRKFLHKRLCLGNHNNNDNSCGNHGLLSGLSSHQSRNPISQPIKNNDYIAFHAHNHQVTATAIAPLETSNVLSLSNDTICELTMEFYQTNADIALVETQPDKKNRNKKGYKENDIASQGSPKPIPSMKELIGGIIVSGDACGIIRIFRSDISPTIRNRVQEQFRKQGSNIFPGVQSTYSNTLSTGSLDNSPNPTNTISEDITEDTKDNQMICSTCGSHNFHIVKHNKQLLLQPIPPLDFYCIDCGNQMKYF